MRQLIWQVSAFTIAHTVTLGLSLYGIVRGAGTTSWNRSSLSRWRTSAWKISSRTRLRAWRVVVVFVFGLLHGLGFAGAMSELPYSHADLVGMLVSFNVGVELGQLAVIATAAAIMHAVVARRETWQRPLARLASAGIGVVGLFWVVERIGLIRPT